MVPAPRARPSASSSSMKMMHGEDLRACSNRSRTRAAPTPTNISTNSAPLVAKNGTPASPATARASSVLPVPGGPTSRMPRGICAPSRVNSSGFFRKSTISCSSAFASSTPATSAKVTFTSVSATSLARDRPTDSNPPPSPPPCRRARPCARDASTQTPTNSSGGSTQDSNVANALLSGDRRERDVCFASVEARSGGTCTVVKLSWPSGSFSDSVPLMVSPATTTLVTLPWFSNCSNWL